ncbi:MAG: HD domain-containing phosphohydrolase [Phycisphaeraceae bacterium]
MALNLESMSMDPIRRRIESLGITSVILAADSGKMRARIEGSARWIEHLLIDCAAFQATIHQAWQEIRTSPGADGGPVTLWPGVWLTPLLAAPHPRRRQTDPLPDHCVAALFVGTEFLHSEQFRLLCDMQRVDYQAALKRIDVAQLATRREADRVSTLIEWMQSDAADAERRGKEVYGLSSELGETYEELSLLYKLAMNMTVDQPPRHFIADACHELQQVVGMRWLAIQLVADDPRLNDLQGEVFAAGDLVLTHDQIRGVGLHLMNIGLDPNLPKVIDDIHSLGLPELSRQSSDLLVVPLATDNRLIGVLFGGQKLDPPGANLTTVDSKLCGALANSLSIFIENFMLYEDMQAMFMGTLHALTSAIDAKDSYTFGHSERVALMSRMLAEAAGLDGQVVERVYVAGLIHDVGKIGVPEAVLCKPGKLTAGEFEQIRMHPEIGARILRDIRQMKDIIPGVLSHHERWDGHGYPFGLAGAEVTELQSDEVTKEEVTELQSDEVTKEEVTELQSDEVTKLITPSLRHSVTSSSLLHSVTPSLLGGIPLFGRLIALADSFDAMSSTRTYRSRLEHGQVINEIRRCAGTQFDPDLASVFVELDFEPYRQMHRRHEIAAQQSDGGRSDGVTK